MHVVRKWRVVAAVVTVGGLLVLAGCGQRALDHRVSGDPRAGLSVYKFEGCGSCHPIAGVSVGNVAGSGPALDGEGDRRGASWLRSMLPGHLRAVKLSPLSVRDHEDLVTYLVSLR
jgi:mono/diheme cytochrome c family protein